MGLCNFKDVLEDQDSINSPQSRFAPCCERQLVPVTTFLTVFETLTIRYVVRRTHYFSSNSKIPRIDHFGLTWDYRKMSKRLVLSIEDQNMTRWLRQKH